MRNLLFRGLIVLFMLLLISAGAYAEAPGATAPAHSPLYHPDYPPEQIIEYFEEVVLDMEYADGTGDVSLVQKWIAPMRYRIYGFPTDEDLSILTAFFDQLNALPGFPGICAAGEEEAENVTISFLDHEGFYAVFSDMLGGDSAFGATRFWYYTETNDIYTANIGYRTDVGQAARNSILIEEIVNTLGVSDTVLRTDSIVYQYSDDNTALSDVDLIILSLLYDPAIECGMDAESCRAVIRELYY
ncbi:MAG: DUF2927 domain-containing protein [Clostridia bacterium]|nr:DUF2927 domain-containing protein [Clostridia bacterium]